MLRPLKKSIIALFFVFLVLLVGGLMIDSEPSSTETPKISETAEKKVVKQNGTDVKLTSPAEAKPTKAQENALASAEQYLNFSGFSKAGLTQQLTSSSGEGFAKKDVLWALNQLNVDWNAEAVEVATTYQEFMPMSRVGLIRQMTAKLGDQFTKKQAEYAADKVGL